MMGAISVLANELDPGEGGAKTVWKTYSDQINWHSNTYGDAWEKVTISLSVNYLYNPSTKHYEYTYYSFSVRVKVSGSSTPISRTGCDTYLLNIAGQNIVHTSKDVTKYDQDGNAYYNGWSSSGSISNCYSSNHLDIYFCIRTEPTLEGFYYNDYYKLENNGYSNSNWVEDIDCCPIGSFGDFEVFW